MTVSRLQARRLISVSNAKLTWVRLISRSKLECRADASAGRAGDLGNGRAVILEGGK